MARGRRSSTFSSLSKNIAQPRFRATIGLFLVRLEPRALHAQTGALRGWGERPFSTASIPVMRPSVSEDLRGRHPPEAGHFIRPVTQLRQSLAPGAVIRAAAFRSPRCFATAGCAIGPRAHRKLSFPAKPFQDRPSAQIVFVHHLSKNLAQPQCVVDRRMSVARRDRIADPEQPVGALQVAHHLLRATFDQRLVIHLAQVC
ncbi:hypothetical protein PAM7066_03459 [Palleronia marisminoris]|uniref:Uncharacterized protein n=1 Tax=Palleronia marisminoris TaxID=315423 RepID=A0A1Y5TUI4_9RHOB|nr:hypothetical protein PAM7066_03459 [Palleronia marisminoris]